MDILVVAFLVAIVLGGGFIGLLADKLGRKLGKKRLTIGRLRPKHTAQLGTFIAGMVVSSLTIVLVAAVSSEVRQWIIEGRQAIRTASRLTKTNSNLQGEIKGQQAQLDRLEEQRSLASTQLTERQAKLVSIQGELSAAQASLASDNLKLNDAKARVAVAQDRLSASENQLAQRKRQLASTQQGLRSAQLNLRALRVSFHNQRQQVIDYGHREHDLQDEIQGLEAKSKGLSAQIVQDTERVKQVQEELALARGQLQQQTDDLIQIRKLVDEEQKKADTYQSLASAARTQPLIFPIGQEVSRLPVPGNLSESQARSSLLDLIRRSSEVAVSQGAVAGRATNLAAGFVERQTLAGQRISPADEEAAIVAGLAGKSQDVVLIAYAQVNAFRGEFLPLEVKGYPNPLVYKTGETVARIRIPASHMRDKVLEAFTTFLRTDVLRNALAKGMIPTEGRPDSLVSIPPIETLQVVDQLARASGPITLQAVARTDTRAADSLKLEFRVK